MRGLSYRKAHRVWAALFAYALGMVCAFSEVHLVGSDVVSESVSENHVKVTWEAELENTSDVEVTVSLTLDLKDSEGTSLQTLSIDSFTIPANATRTAVQTRPISAKVWNDVSTHEIDVSE